MIHSRIYFSRQAQYHSTTPCYKPHFTRAQPIGRNSHLKNRHTSYILSQNISLVYMYFIENNIYGPTAGIIVNSERNVGHRHPTYVANIVDSCGTLCRNLIVISTFIIGIISLVDHIQIVLNARKHILDAKIRIYDVKFQLLMQFLIRPDHLCIWLLSGDMSCAIFAKYDYITAENCSYIDRDGKPVIVGCFGALALLLDIQFYIICA